MLLRRYQGPHLNTCVVNPRGRQGLQLKNQNSRVWVLRDCINDKENRTHFGSQKAGRLRQSSTARSC